VPEIERRLTPRVRLAHLVYIHVEPDGGAIVLDVSDGGVGFHSVAPFHEMGTISFHFSLRSIKGLHVSAEIAWVDKTHKSGGLKFSGLSPETVSEIRNRLTPSLPMSDRKDEPPSNKLIMKNKSSHDQPELMQSFSNDHNIETLFNRFEHLEKRVDALLDRLMQCENQLKTQGRKPVGLRWLARFSKRSAPARLSRK
jgi:hypothetical protein